MDTWVWIVIALAIIGVVALGVAWYGMQQRAQQRREGLRQDFGPEYDRAVDRYGDEGEADAALLARRERVQKLRLKEIPREQRQRLQTNWTTTQARFVDDPASAMDDADGLVEEAMKARGYPLGGDLDQRFDDLSVEHGHVLNNYREGHEIAERRQRGEDVSTEDLRRSMVCYRALFSELLNTGAGKPTMEAGRREQQGNRPARQT